ncbi:MAG TPA: hypothetical protein VG013_36415 [Gemmataceae bacterium]|nr:hypothetical protein [Gemmataceae bacterium]
MCLLAAATAVGQEPASDPTVPAPAPAAPVWSLAQLAGMSWPELEQLYRQAEPGTIPQGYTPGKAIYCPDSPRGVRRSKMTNAVWHGKIFNACEGTLINQWCGFRAIKAKVCYGPSWLDGKPSIIMDYSETSLVWEDVRDELREVAPGLYLGRMYRRKPCGPEFQCFFALQACPSNCSHP